MSHKEKKTEYLQCRITPGDKRVIEKGADVRGLDVSDYVRMFVLEAAKKDVEKAYLQNNISLSSAEWESFLQIMDTPAELNSNLQQAFERLEEMESTSQEPFKENFG